MGHINQPGPTGQITRFLGLPLAYPLAYATIGPLLPRHEDPSVANIIAGFCTTGFLPVSLFLEIMATGLKRTTTRTPPYWYACSSPRQNTLSSVPDQFCNYLFRLRSRILPLQPSEIPTRAYQTKGTSRVASIFRRFREGTPKYLFERLILSDFQHKMYIDRVMGSNMSFFVSDWF